MAHQQRMKRQIPPPTNCRSMTNPAYRSAVLHKSSEIR
ncbi:MAG: hypothetical protein E5299_01251 [Burkholderia gladioli]|nr:MAG: hypothetical protein E5299_01251 [Burkholderia gladioli]